MRTLPAQHLRARDYSDMEAQLLLIFHTLIFKPIAAIMKENNAQALAGGELENAAGDAALKRALRSGRIQYEAGTFSGIFNRAIADACRAIGATWDKRAKVYRVSQANVPGWIMAEAGAYDARARKAHAEILRKLNELEEGILSAVEGHPVDAKPTVSKVEGGFKSAAKALEIKPELTDESRARLAKDYSNNMKLWITDFSKKEIRELRAGVEANAEQGYRFDKLIETIKTRYGVAENKARFLARQETGLFMAKFRRERFGEAGVSRYVWSTSEDGRVRPAPGLTPAQRRHAGNHRKLNGQIFSYKDKAPGAFMSSGKPCNPGEDFNCRCVDIAILDPIGVGAAA